jgi:peptide/nickel transport system substrate-binding protein
MSTHKITRRQTLTIAAQGALATGAAELLAACGSSSSSKTTQTTNTPRRGGILRAGLTGGGGTDTVDAQNSLSLPDFARGYLMFNALVLQNAAGQPTFDLAEEITPNKTATEWTVRVKKGVEFHNGKELTADDVVYSFKRALDPKHPTQDTQPLILVDQPNIRKIDKYTTAFPCHSPFATFTETLAGVASGIAYAIIPVGFDPHKPIGTGPFKYVRFVPNQITVTSRNPNYWETGKPYLDGVVLTEYADETSQVNALVSGQEDVADSLSAASVGQVTGAGHKVLVSDAAGYNPFVMQVTKPPFNDVRVRQALRLALDRPQFLKLLFGGRGRVGNDVFGLLDPDFDHSLPQRQQDLDQAKSLLRQAGHQNLTVQFASADIGQGTILSAQVLAQQLAAIGVKVQIQQLTVTTFFGTDYLKRPFTIGGPWNYFPYLPNVASATLTSAPFNETAFSDAKYDRLFHQASSTLDIQLRRELVHEMLRIDYDSGGYMIPFFPPVIDGYADHVHGLTPALSGLPLSNFRFQNLWMT